MPEFSEVRALREENRAFKVRRPEIKFADHTGSPEICLGPREGGLEI